MIDSQALKTVLGDDVLVRQIDVSPALVRVLLERTQRDLDRIGDLPPAGVDDSLEMNHRRAQRDRLIAELKNFEGWLQRYSTGGQP